MAELAGTTDILFWRRLLGFLEECSYCGGRHKLGAVIGEFDGEPVHLCPEMSLMTITNICAKTEDEWPSVIE